MRILKWEIVEAREWDRQKALISLARKIVGVDTSPIRRFANELHLHAEKMRPVLNEGEVHQYGTWVYWDCWGNNMTHIADAVDRFVASAGPE